MTVTTAKTTGTVTCDDCGDRHVAEYHHDATHGGERMFEVYCPGDGLVGYYAETRVEFPAETITAYFSTCRGKVTSWEFGSDNLDRRVQQLYVNRNNAAAARRGDDSKPYAVRTVTFQARP